MRNPSGALRRSNGERGRRNRKEEDRLAGFRRRGRTETIAEQIGDVLESSLEQQDMVAVKPSPGGRYVEQEKELQLIREKMASLTDRVTTLKAMNAELRRTVAELAVPDV